MMEVGEEALYLLTVPEVATRLRLSEVTVWRLIRAWRENPGTGLESVKSGRSRRVPPEAVAAYKAKLLEESRQGAA